MWHPAPPSCLIFQSTLRRTERPIVSGYAKKLGIFQSTLRRTERRHARTLLTCLFYNFNPRSDERSDIIYSYINNCFSYFNPRSDERSDPDICSIHFFNDYFNPRSDERSDILSAVTNQIPEISIHAPTNGATLPQPERKCNMAISIHAPTNGATRICGNRQRHRAISIHAPTNGATI